MATIEKKRKLKWPAYFIIKSAIIKKAMRHELNIMITSSLKTIFKTLLNDRNQVNHLLHVFFFNLKLCIEDYSCIELSEQNFAWLNGVR